LNKLAATVPVHGDDLMFGEVGAAIMPLTVTRLAKNVLRVAHFYFQNGDQMLDPEMEFWRPLDSGPKGKWSVSRYRADPYIDSETLVFNDGWEARPTGIRRKALRMASVFAPTFLTNVMAYYGSEIAAAIKTASSRGAPVAQHHVSVARPQTAPQQPTHASGDTMSPRTQSHPNAEGGKPASLKHLLIVTAAISDAEIASRAETVATAVMTAMDAAIPPTSPQYYSYTSDGFRDVLRSTVVTRITEALVTRRSAAPQTAPPRPAPTLDATPELDATSELEGLRKAFNLFRASRPDDFPLSD